VALLTYESATTTTATAGRDISTGLQLKAAERGIVLEAVRRERLAVGRLESQLDAEILRIKLVALVLVRLVQLGLWQPQVACVHERRVEPEHKEHRFADGPLLVELDFDVLGEKERLLQLEGELVFIFIPSDLHLLHLVLVSTDGGPIIINNEPDIAFEFWRIGEDDARQ